MRKQSSRYSSSLRDQSPHLPRTGVTWDPPEVSFLPPGVSMRSPTRRLGFDGAGRAELWRWKQYFKLSVRRVEYERGGKSSTKMRFRRSSQSKDEGSTREEDEQVSSRQQYIEGGDTSAVHTFETTKSTKGASKMRRDLINAEISNLRDLLPLPPTTRQRLSQLQLMALVCVYVRKINYFQQVLKSHDFTYRYQQDLSTVPSVGFSKAINGFIMMLTQGGKLLYISENAAEYLGHSMEDLLIHGDSVYDIIDRQDHQAVQAELNGGTDAEAENLPKTRRFFCRMNVSRNSRRQMRFGDQKVVLVRGHFVSYLPLCSRNEPVFLATCTPLAMPETRECVVHGATNVFTSIHSMDMKIVHIDQNAEWYLGWEKSELTGISWYQLLHWESLKEAQNKHRLLTHSEQDKCCILLARLQNRAGHFMWVHIVLQVKDSSDSPQQMIVATNQVLSESEASIMMSNSWLYNYYGYQSQPCSMTLDPRCQNFLHSDQYYPEYQEYVNPEEEYQYPQRYVSHVEDGSERIYGDKGPVDYSTHSPHSTISEDRSPHGYDYVTEVAVNGEVYLYPATQAKQEPYAYAPDVEYRVTYHRGGTLERVREDARERIVAETVVRSHEPTRRDVRSNKQMGEEIVHQMTEIKRPRLAPTPLCLDATEVMDRWNPSPPWSDSALKLPGAPRFNYIPLAPSERPLCT